MGLGDALIKLGIRYGSEESIKICDRIGLTMADTAIATSAALAEEKGVYPKYKNCVLRSNYFVYNASNTTWDKVNRCGLRNSQLLTTAPTGSLSSMLGVSGGIEPIYANYYTRKTESLHGHDEYYKVYTPIVEQYMKEHFPLHYEVENVEYSNEGSTYVQKINLTDVTGKDKNVISLNIIMQLKENYEFVMSFSM